MELLCRAPDDLDIEAVSREFFELGYARLGPCASPAILEALRARLDEIMLGGVDHHPFFYQHDSANGDYEDLPRGEGWQGPSRDYRKIEKLERDPVFWAWLNNPLFARLAHSLVGPEISLCRALVFTKSAAGGTHLPWHQDGGLFWGLDRAPFLQVWTALDDAPVEAGCVEVIPGTHRGGLTRPFGGLVTADRVAPVIVHTPVIALPAVAGEVILIHNLLWHRSGRNTTGKPRRGFSACLMDAATRCLRKRGAPRQFRRVFAPEVVLAGAGKTQVSN